VTVEQWEFISEALMARGAPPGVTREGIAARAAVFRDTWSPEHLLAFREANRSIDLTADLSRIEAPTLVLFLPLPGGSMEESRLLAREIPDAQLFSGGLDGGRLDGRTLERVLRFLGSDALDRVPATNAPASGVRTVLFTDLVGHTEIMQLLGDARGRELLREHERLTRETLKAHGGVEVKTMGDGFMASFTSVSAAVDCAVELQRAFAAWNDAHGGDETRLLVRCGLNAGEPIEDEGDLFGATVILASRVAAQAGAGEVLIPEPVRHLLAGKGHVFADRGEFLPKGFDDAVRLYEVRWQSA
jgi:class 3 adenylate cyclase